MNLILHPHTPTPIAEIRAETLLLQQEDDAITVMEELFPSGSKKVILHQQNLSPDFFELRTRLAGLVLQKFVNYGIQVAVVGDFSNLTSDALKAFIYESNRGKHVFFVDSVEKALKKMA